VNGCPLPARDVQFSLEQYQMLKQSSVMSKDFYNLCSGSSRRRSIAAQEAG
jgi:hypothetical protein